MFILNEYCIYNISHVTIRIVKIPKMNEDFRILDARRKPDLELLSRLQADTRIELCRVYNILYSVTCMLPTFMSNCHVMSLPNNHCIAPDPHPISP